jgi:hypothetical protein
MKLDLSSFLYAEWVYRSFEMTPALHPILRRASNFKRSCYSKPRRSVMRVS